eukprot:s5134_g5.t1
MYGRKKYLTMQALAEMLLELDFLMGAPPEVCDEAPSFAEFRLKLKAKGFVDPLTTIAEVGTVRETGPEKACTGTMKLGQKFSWKVSNKEYDLMMTLPARDLGVALDFEVQIASAVDVSGHNSEELTGRQVTQWVASAFLGNSKHNVWYKIGLSLNGDFSRGVQTSPTNVTVPEEAAKASETAAFRTFRTLRVAVAWHFLTLWHGISVHVLICFALQMCCRAGGDLEWGLYHPDRDL